MTYKYRVTLTGLKGFYRLYHIGSTQSLYAFHKQMRSDMEFPQDQLILFKALNANGDVVARYGLFDLGDGTVDRITMADTVKNEITSFVYFYDVTNKRSVDITFEGEAESEATAPVLVEVKGPNPIEFIKGYVAFEDLPDPKQALQEAEEAEAEKEGKKKKGGLADILGIDEDDLDDEDDEDEDDEDEYDEDEDEDDIEEEEQIYDEQEGLD
ncbi:MAG: hypothetical protein IJS07_06555 [Bacteroidales bacterium]|nr:hypothetical protein [Bacteroidales bacterium]